MSLSLAFIISNFFAHANGTLTDVDCITLIYILQVIYNIGPFNIFLVTFFVRFEEKEIKKGR